MDIAVDIGVDVAVDIAVNKHVVTTVDDALCAKVDKVNSIKIIPIFIPKSKMDTDMHKMLLRNNS